MPLLDGLSRRLAHHPAFNPAGGVNYHLRARRHARKLWEPFRWALGEWLLGWAPPEPNLVVVGPSAGYNLQPFLFERFERVIALEPDPLARWLFRRRLARAPLDPRPRLEFIGSDHLVFHPERLLPLLEGVGPAALLFCNVLGQIVTLLDGDAPEEILSAVKQGVRAACAGRSHASFHDRVSGPLPPGLEGVVPSPRRWTDAEVLARAYAVADGPPLIELDDHYTEGFFPEDVPHSYFRWEVQPGSYHLIEAVALVEPAGEQRPAGARAGGRAR